MGELVLSLVEQIQTLSKDDALGTLNRVLVGLDLTDVGFHSVLETDSFNSIVVRASREFGKTTPNLSEDHLIDEAAAYRFLLTAMAENPQLQGRVQGALLANRQVLFDPVVTSLVIAGIVAILSTEMTITIHDGKLDLKMHKRATSEDLLTKFFALFK